MHISSKIKKVVLYILIGTGSLLFVGIVFILYSFGAFTANRAQKDFQPMIKTLKQIDARKLCDNGDNGKGIDNNAPWYEAYYSVNKTASMQSEIVATASSMDYQLSHDAHTTSQLQDSGGYNHSVYLIAHHNGGVLTVRIAYQGDTVPLYCGVKNYGQTVSPTSSQAILDFNLSLPQQNN